MRTLVQLHYVSGLYHFQVPSQAVRLPSMPYTHVRGSNLMERCFFPVGFGSSVPKILYSSLVSALGRHCCHMFVRTLSNTAESRVEEDFEQSIHGADRCHTRS